MRRRGIGLVGGQAIGQIALVLVLPVLTRAFEPQEFGYYQAALSIALVVQPLATLRLELILPILSKSLDIKRYGRLCRWSICLAVGVVLGSSIVALLTGARELAEMLAMVGLSLAAYSWIAIDNAGLIRREELNRLAIRSALAGILTASLQVAASFVTSDILVLAVALLVGRMIALLATRRWRTLTDQQRQDHGSDGAVFEYGMRRAALTVLTGIVSSASVQALTVYSFLGLSSAAAGLVGVAQRAAGAPMVMAGQALSQFTQATTAPYVRNGTDGLHHRVMRQVIMLSLIAVAATVAIAILGPVLAGPILGPEWSGAGPIVAILALPMSMQLVASPTAAIFIMIARERTLLWLQLTRLAVSLGLAIAAQVLTNDVFWTCAAFSAGTVIAYVIQTVILIRVLRAREVAMQAVQL